jgi:hypothetical protein
MRIIKTYDRMMNHLLAWHEGHISFLAVIGKHGTGKSRGYEDLFPNGGYTLFKGKTTAFQIYMTVYDNPDRPIVFDDVSDLLKDSACVELMKTLCDTRKSRKVQWNTMTDKLEGRAKEFTISAPVLVVCNHNLLDNADVQAVLDRADAVEFAPPKKEIIAKLKTYATDLEIVELLETMPVLPSLRTYEKALDWKKSSRLDMREELLAECGVQPEVQTLLEIYRTVPEKERCQAYMNRTGRSQRDFYNKLTVVIQLAEAA